MRSFLLLFMIVGIGVSRGWALPAASDFKEVGAEETATESEGDSAGLERMDTQVSDAAALKLENNEQIISGTVRVLRKIDMTEVFFKDHKDSYYIPSGRNYSSIFKACQESAKKNTPISFKVNTKSRRILSMEQAPSSGSKPDGAK